MKTESVCGSSSPRLITHAAHSKLKKDPVLTKFQNPQLPLPSTPQQIQDATEGVLPSGEPRRVFHERRRVRRAEVLSKVGRECETRVPDFLGKQIESEREGRESASESKSSATRSFVVHPFLVRSFLPPSLPPSLRHPSPLHLFPSHPPTRSHVITNSTQERTNNNDSPCPNRNSSAQPIPPSSSLPPLRPESDSAKQTPS